MSIINPRQILKKKTTIRPIAEKAIQPNSIDLTIKDAKEILSGGELSECRKKVVLGNSILKKDWFHFGRGKPYDIVFNEYVIVPKGTAAFINCRSSLNRIGAFITSGIYDTGFNNYIGAVLRTDVNIKIKKETRIATIYFLKAKASRLYSGQYQGKCEKK